MITADASSPLQYQVPCYCEGATPAQLESNLRQAVEQATYEGRGLLLHGPTGVGKTFALAAARRASYAGGRYKRQPFFVDWPEFVTDVSRYEQSIRGQFDDYSKFDPEARLFRYEGPLFVDDVGAEREVPSGFRQGEAEALFNRFVNRRTGMLFPLWITTNLTPPEIRARYGERTASRLTQHCTIVAFAGADRRIA